MGLPATRPASAPAPLKSPAGYEPERLDAVLQTHLATATRVAGYAGSLQPKIDKALADLRDLPDFEAGTCEGCRESLVRERVELMVALHEKLTKSDLNLVKTIDEMSRLRSFLAGGPDSRPDLSLKGEHDLRGMLEETVKSLGFKLVPLEVA